MTEYVAQFVPMIWEILIVLKDVTENLVEGVVDLNINRVENEGKSLR